MKNLTLLFAIGLILLTGCTKDESYEQIEGQTTDPIIVLNNSDGSHNQVPLKRNDVLKPTAITISTNDRAKAHTEGYYLPTARDAMTITWSGTQNGNTTRGSAEIQQSTPNYSFHFILETECVMVDGNQAVYGGTITQVRALSGDAPQIGVGWRFYFKVTDNVVDLRSGNAVRYDQIANTSIFSSPRSPSLCNVYLPNDRMWSSQGVTNIFSPGFVVVSK